MIYEYEVQLKVTIKSTGAKELVTRIEHAYSVTDACMQACLNHSARYIPGEMSAEIQHVGPPADALRAAAIAKDVERALAKCRP